MAQKQAQKVVNKFVKGLITEAGELTFPEDASRTEILTGLSTQTLGTIGTSFLSVLVALACFTTGVGIVTGAADYAKGIFKDSQKAFNLPIYP